MMTFKLTTLKGKLYDILNKNNPAVPFLFAGVGESLSVKNPIFENVWYHQEMDWNKLELGTDTGSTMYSILMTGILSADME